jgi:tetratricopeptide (TPR) repeat protein
MISSNHQRVSSQRAYARTVRASLVFVAGLGIVFAFCASATFAQKRKQPVSSASARSITIRTEPNAVVWIDEVRRGVADAEGRLALKSITPGRRALRVRANGFKESNTVLAPTQRGHVVVRLVPTTNEAELAFQEAETAREKARDEEARKNAAEMYRRAIQLRPKYGPAYVGLARVLLDLNDYNNALETIASAHTARPNYAEAFAVEGRILRMVADEDAAIEAFQRAIRAGKNFQPEAHTGLAIVYEDKGRYDEAAAEFRLAIAQLSDTEPVIYQLLGAVYEKLEKYAEAVAAYEKYLALAPDGSLAPAIRSVMDQLRKQAEGRGGLPY